MDEDFIQAGLHPIYASYYWEDRGDNFKSEEQIEWEAEMVFERGREDNY